MEDAEKFREQLFAPMPGTRPDAVSQQVIEDEMAAFQAARAQVR